MNNYLLIWRAMWVPKPRQRRVFSIRSILSYPPINRLERYI